MKISNTLLKLGVALSIFVMAQGSAQAVVINTYTSAASWQANVGAFVTEDFEDAALQAPLTGYLTNNGSIGGGVWNDVVGPSQQTNFQFNPGVYGIGGDWDLDPLGLGTGIRVDTVNGTYFIGDILSSGFWGFTIDESILTVVLTEGPVSSGAQETYTLDNMLIATSPGTTTSVPEPAILALMGLGLAGIGYSRRKRTA